METLIDKVAKSNEFHVKNDMYNWYKIWNHVNGNQRQFKHFLESTVNVEYIPHIIDSMRLFDINAGLLAYSLYYCAN